MRKWFIIAAAAFQGLVLAYMAGEREVVVLTGRIVYLRTAPIDPRDIFRGDFVRLNYEISTIPRRLLRGGLAGAKESYLRKKGLRVYTALKAGEGGSAEALYVTDRRPRDDFFIRGHLRYRWDNTVRVRYGIETYFVEQGRGLELERGRRREGIQVPLEMEVAVASNGLAVLKSHRWSALGIGLELVRGTDRSARAVKLRLLNASEKPLAIVDLPGTHCFSLEPVSSRRTEKLRWAGADVPRPVVSGDHVRVLQPGEIHSVRIDFTDSSWYVARGGALARPIYELDRSAMFRLVYRPPTKKASEHLEQAELVWHGHLPSRAFNGRGWVD